MKKVKLYLEDLSCPNCADKIEGELDQTEGVEKVDVHFATAKAKVEYDQDQVSVDGLKEAISKTGYQVIKVR